MYIYIIFISQYRLHISTEVCPVLWNLVVVSNLQGALKGILGFSRANWSLSFRLLTELLYFHWTFLIHFLLYFDELLLFICTLHTIAFYKLTIALPDMNIYCFIIMFTDHVVSYCLFLSTLYLFLLTYFPSLFLGHFYVFTIFDIDNIDRFIDPTRPATSEYVCWYDKHVGLIEFIL